MSKEIERKFIVKDNSYREKAEGILYRQAYLSTDPEKVVRIRVVNSEGYITIKGPSKGIVRDEYEYEIPYNDANSMIDQLCEKPVIEKYRYKTEYCGFIWEIDEFIGVNKGLVLAEIELTHEGDEFLLPQWIGEEVTGDPRYYNSNLVNKPFSTW